MEHLQEKRVGSTELCKGSFLHVLRDTVELSNGALTTREYVVHPGAVMVVPLIEDAQGEVRLVLERQFRYPLNRVMVEFPAGKKDPGEEPFQCAQRELREETGYQARFWAHAGVMHPVAAYSTEVIDIWFAKGLTAGARQLDADELLDVFTATPAELLTWCREGQITDAKTLLAALWLQNVFSGAWTLDWFETT
ncbi:NUDIX domain-containing protein [Rhodoferax sp. U11-2br]|uniref:NUDIX domain-containing protein n=1 Tax=Rhodoferax sp. U11-2br TaxID=2838878 RepID=UPI001BECD8A7|nr:NUDIX hydrolase [Rhodoferax sp. U11-2br]MBT3065769.1 NUDIX hydrolase [Rhodoferax sp. U11-2br]